jgi:hypothetical protein
MTSYIETNGQKPEISEDTVIAVLFRNDETSVGPAEVWDWSWSGDESGEVETGYEIIAYKVVV